MLLPEKGKQEKKTLSCGVCGETQNTQFCAGCRSVVYCSVSHQKENWKSHKSICIATRKFPFKLIAYDDEEESHSAGQYSQMYPIASQDLEPGDVIVEEFPLFSYIGYIQDNATKKSRSCRRTGNRKFNFCVTCGNSLLLTGSDNPGNTRNDGMGTEASKKPKQNVKKDAKLHEKYECENCRWPVCSKKCAQNPLHAENECKVFRGNNVKYIGEMSNNEDDFFLDGFFRLVTVARAHSVSLYKPKTWIEMMEFVSRNEMPDFLRHSLSVKARAKTSSGSAVPKFLLTTKEDRERLNDMFLHITDISRHVGFSKPVGASKELSNNNWFHLLYKHASHFPHACAPNCNTGISSFPDLRIRIRAAVKIKKGDRLFLNLLGPCLAFRGTWIRQKIFLERFRRPCACSLCSDPTELDTHQSSLVCPNCYTEKKCEKNDEGVLQSRYIVPNFPISVTGANKKKGDKKNRATTTFPLKKDSTNAYWECPHCSYVVSPSMRVDIQKKILEKYDTLLRYERGDVSICIVQELEKLQRERKTFISPNHWLFQFSLFLYCEKRLKCSELGYTEMDSLYNMYSYLISSLDVTCPGLQLDRIEIKHHFGAEIVMQSVLPMTLGMQSFVPKNLGNQKDLEKFINVLEVAESYLDEAVLFWKGHVAGQGNNLDHCLHFHKLATSFLEALQDRYHTKIDKTIEPKDEEQSTLAVMEKEMMHFSEAERE